MDRAIVTENGRRYGNEAERTHCYREHTKACLQKTDWYMFTAVQTDKFYARQANSRLQSKNGRAASCKARTEKHLWKIETERMIEMSTDICSIWRFWWGRFQCTVSSWANWCLTNASKTWAQRLCICISKCSIVCNLLSLPREKEKVGTSFQAGCWFWAGRWNNTSFSFILAHAGMSRQFLYYTHKPKILYRWFYPAIVYQKVCRSAKLAKCQFYALKNYIMSSIPH